MPFANGLRESLQFRKSQVPAELTNGNDLEQVLGRYLLAVEAMADGELITSILLLSADGKRLSHGAAPGLPQSYWDDIDGSEIGPCAGSCGTAAFLGRPIYVSDIATDPLWVDYRHFALPHGLRSCWSTPIREPDGAIVGTFAIYRRTVGNPTRDEIETIGMITEHVAEAITLARDVQDLQPAPHRQPRLRIVAVDQPQPELPADRCSRLLSLATRMESKIAELDRIADQTKPQEAAETLKATAELSRKLVAVLRAKIGEMDRTPLA
jgi:GAF domain-containing protein